MIFILQLHQWIHQARFQIESLNSDWLIKISAILKTLKKAQLWHFERENSLRLFAGHQETVNCVKFHPNSNYLFTGSDDRSIRLWDINSGKCERVFFMNNQGAYKASVSTIDLSPSGKLIAAGYDDGTIRQVYK